MCGITGHINLGRIYPTTKEVIKKMTNVLYHRGPDDSGCFFQMEDGRILEEKDTFGDNDKEKLPIKAALGHRRLSIIDLSPLGHQPMSNKRKNVWVVFNGEIYNYKELKDECKGYEFISNSDTEAILASYEKYQSGFIERLDGMFSLALWDKENERLILARDPMGKKPLYYSVQDQTLIFASELKSLILHPLIKREIDMKSLRKYLFYGYIPSPNSIFKGIKKILAGHFLVFSKNGIEIKQYWTPRFREKRKTISENEAISDLKSLLENAVKKRLISDVPLGIFLSGGIDSSTITFFASKLVPRIKTFSIGFTEKGYDELGYARNVAKFIESDHYDEVLSIDKLLDIIPKIPEILDEPMADTSIIPTYLLSLITRKKVTVALGGDGGDELFAGYPTYLGHRVFEYYKKIPSLFRKGIAEMVNLLPTRLGYYTFDYKAKKFISGDGFLGEVRHQLWSSYFLPQEVERLFVNKEEGDVFEDIEFYLKDCNSSNMLERMLFLDMKLYFPESILVKVDRASMAHSLEVRAPFLDKKLMDFINCLPISYKLHSLTGKYLLKKVMKGLLPNEILYRKKQGFSVPVGEWIRKELKGLTQELFEKSRIDKDGIFAYNFVKQLLDEHISLKKNNWKPIWALLVFQLWHERYIE
ncbi:MAG: asparagine synthase (glutamine-hydrolyzing) [bacterium]